MQKLQDCFNSMAVNVTAFKEIYKRNGENPLLRFPQMSFDLDVLVKSAVSGWDQCVTNDWDGSNAIIL